MNYEVRQLGKDTWMIRSMMVQMFLIAGTEKAMLIDTGAGMGVRKSRFCGMENGQKKSRPKAAKEE